MAQPPTARLDSPGSSLSNALTSNREPVAETSACADPCPARNDAACLGQLKRRCTALTDEPQAAVYAHIKVIGPKPPRCSQSLRRLATQRVGERGSGVRQGQQRGRGGWLWAPSSDCACIQGRCCYCCKHTTRRRAAPATPRWWGGHRSQRGSWCRDMQRPWRASTPPQPGSLWAAPI